MSLKGGRLAILGAVLGLIGWSLEKFLEVYKINPADIKDDDDDANVAGLDLDNPTEPNPEKDESAFTSVDAIQTAAAAASVAAGANQVRRIVAATGRGTLRGSAARPDIRVRGDDGKFIKKDKWTRFMEFVAKRNKDLWAKVATRLATASLLATVPIAGWFWACVNLGFGFWGAYELFQLWKEFTNEPEEKLSGESPEPVNDDDYLRQLVNPTPADAPAAARSPTPAAVPADRPAMPPGLDAALLADQARQPAYDDTTPALIGFNESGGKYDTIFGKSGNATIDGKLVTQNTLAEIIAWQKKLKHTNRHAVGKYQFMNVESLAEKGKIPLNSLFDPAMQERLYQIYREGNRNTLKNLGLPITPFTELAAHSVGPTGLANLLRADPNAIAADVLNLQGAARKTNERNLVRPVSQVLAEWAQKAGERPPAATLVASAGAKPNYDFVVDGKKPDAEPTLVQTASGLMGGALSTMMTAMDTLKNEFMEAIEKGKKEGGNVFVDNSQRNTTTSTLSQAVASAYDSEMFKALVTSVYTLGSH